jgi:hypothetical protein
MSEAMAIRSCAVGRFLALFRHPRGASELREADWDDVVRVGRGARLLGALAARIDALDERPAIPECVRAHLVSERAVARHRAAMAAFELREIARTLAPLGVPLVALKGAAYLLQGLPHASGRLFADVDVMVPRAALARVEPALLAAGWEMPDLHPYDLAYYRRWAHELPPLRSPVRGVEIDVHHALLPLTSRLQPDPQALFARALPVTASPYRVLCPEDQVLHASVQLFHDSDCTGKLRELADIDGLLREFARIPGFGLRLADRAVELGLTRPLWYALRYAPPLLGTPVDPALHRALQAAAPPAAAREIMDALLARALLPDDPDCRPGPAERIARGALFARSHWLRMPPALLAWHAAHKLARRWTAAPAEARPAAGADA